MHAPEGQSCRAEDGSVQRVLNEVVFVKGNPTLSVARHLLM